MKRKWIGFIFLIVLAIAMGRQPATGPASVAADGVVLDQFVYLPAVNKAPALMCRFGVATLGNPTQKPTTFVPIDPTEGYANAAHLKQLKAGSLINWGIDPNVVLDPEITFLHVILTGARYNQDVVDGLAAKTALYPGQYWQIGNEPDTCYGEQDCTTPEIYAQQYFDIATKLRALDPSAKIGFGSIVQPTKIRRFYLQLAWDKLETLAGSTENASALVDFWTIHSFILNEEACPTFPYNCPWGTGLPTFTAGTIFPVGVAGELIPDTAKERANYDYSDVYNINIFKTRIAAMRDLMFINGERDKPLWITEYGNLFPSSNAPGNNYETVSDATTAAYMVSTFDYLRSATSATTGMPDDGNRLVQRWFWYSLNDYPYVFGGTLFHPSTGAITKVGQAYANYTAALQPEDNCK